MYEMEEQLRMTPDRTSGPHINITWEKKTQTWTMRGFTPGYGTRICKITDVLPNSHFLHMGAFASSVWWYAATVYE